MADFNSENFARQSDMIAEDSLTLYVDYSTCIAEGMKTSEFYVKLVPSFVQATKTFHSIKGDVIAQEELADRYNRLLNVEEVNFADLKSATEQIADGKRRKRERSVRETLRALFRVLRTGAQWRSFPSDFGPWQTVYYYFRKWRDEGVFEQLSTLLVGEARQAAEAEPGHHRLAQRENVAPRGRGPRHRREQESERAQATRCH